VQIHDRMIEALQRRDLKAYRDLVVRQIRAAIDCYDSQLRAPSPGRRGNSTAGESRRTRASAK
jgi:hypothetical protein